MSQPELRTFDQRGILIGPAGDTLTGAAHALLLFDGASDRTADKIERNKDTPHLGAKPSSMKNFRAMINGTIELTPPAAPGQPTTGVSSAKRALLCCKITETLSALTRVTRLTPHSGADTLSDAEWWHAGLYLAVANMAGDLSELSMEIGQRFTGKTAYEGTYEELAEDALPNDFDLSAFPEPTVAQYNNSTLILHSLGDTAISDLHLRAKSLKFNLGNEKAVKEYTEYKKGKVSKRNGSFTLRIALTDLGDFNPDDFYRNREFITLEWKLSETDGRYSLLGVRGQVDGVKEVDIEGDAGFEITGACIPSDAGNDEVWIEFGDDTFALNGTLSGGVDGVAYVANGLTASGIYTAPLTWDISVGALPAGLSINASTGVITGTPSGGAGTTNFTIRATDSTSGTALVATKAVSIEVTA